MRFGSSSSNKTSHASSLDTVRIQELSLSTIESL